MKVDGKNVRTIWLNDDEKSVKIIDQRKLPHELIIENLKIEQDNGILKHFKSSEGVVNYVSRLIEEKNLKLMAVERSQHPLQ